MLSEINYDWDNDIFLVLHVTRESGEESKRWTVYVPERHETIADDEIGTLDKTQLLWRQPPGDVEDL